MSLGSNSNGRKGEGDKEVLKVVCEVCGKGYSKGYVNRHIKNVHGGKGGNGLGLG